MGSSPSRNVASIPSDLADVFGPVLCDSKELGPIDPPFFVKLDGSSIPARSSSLLDAEPTSSIISPADDALVAGLPAPPVEIPSSPTIIRPVEVLPSPTYSIASTASWTSDGSASISDLSDSFPATPSSGPIDFASKALVGILQADAADDHHKEPSVGVAATLAPKDDGLSTSTIPFPLTDSPPSPPRLRSVKSFGSTTPPRKISYVQALAETPVRPSASAASMLLASPLQMQSSSKSEASSIFSAYDTASVLRALGPTPRRLFTGEEGDDEDPIKFDAMLDEVNGLDDSWDSSSDCSDGSDASSTLGSDDTCSPCDWGYGTDQIYRDQEVVRHRRKSNFFGGLDLQLFRSTSRIGEGATPVAGRPRAPRAWRAAVAVAPMLDDIEEEDESEEDDTSEEGQYVCGEESAL